MPAMGIDQMSSDTDLRGRRAPAFDAVLLDAAGTLIRPRRPVGDTYAEIARRYGGDLRPDRLTTAFVEVFRKMPDLAFTWGSLPELRRLEHEWWRTLVKGVVARSGGTAGDFPVFFEALYEYYAGGQAWECFPEVPGVLDALRCRGCALAVVSNFDSRLPGILRDLGIRPQMDAVIYSSRAGSAKPDPSIFRKALEALGAAPDRAIHVGDNAGADLGGALGAGMSGLLIRRHPTPGAVSATTIRSLEELISRVEASGP
jgi:putative hydrolase of the HAD superfamily